MRHPHPGQEPFTGALLQSQHMEGFRKKSRPKRRRKYSQATGSVKIFQKKDTIEHTKLPCQINSTSFLMLTHGCARSFSHQPIHQDALEGAIRNPIQQEEVVGRACIGSVFSLPMCMTVVVLFMHEKITVFCDNRITNTFELDNGSDFIVI